MKPEKKISKKTAISKNSAEKTSKAENGGEKTRKTPARKPKASPKKETPEIPSILLEGDQPSAPVPSGPGQRYALGPTPPTEHFDDLGELPESYGTKKLIV